MEVVIVGGSLSGLLHAIVFKHLGHNVSVLERSSRDFLQSQASGLNAGPEVRKMIDSYIKIDKQYARASNLVEVINIEGKVINSFPSDDTLYLTTWRVLYDIFKSHFLEAPEGAKGPLATYQTNKLVRNVQYDGEKVVVAYGDTLTGVSSILHADLVIAADGAHSMVRKTVLPNVQPKYAGYITWRGAVPEYSLSEKSRKMLKDRNIFLKTGQGYILSYHVPSESGSVEPGDCQFIWVWYEMLEEGSQDFIDIFTDVSGTRHLSTIPRGNIQPKVWAKKRESGAALNAAFVELVDKTSDPFVSAIRDVAAVGSVFYDGKLLLVGDAFALFRPHVGMSTNQAAMQALGLADVFQGKVNLEEWERSSLDYAKKTSARSIAFGEFSFTGKVPKILSNDFQPDDQEK